MALSYEISIASNVTFGANLSEYPGLLEQQGTDGFRVAAYRHTADLVERLDRPKMLEQ